MSCTDFIDGPGSEFKKYLNVRQVVQLKLIELPKQESVKEL